MTIWSRTGSTITIWDGRVRMNFGQQLDRNHPATMANRAFPQRVTCELLVSIPIVRAWRRWRRGFVGCYVLAYAAMVQLLFAASIAQEYVLTNAVDSTGANVDVAWANVLFC